MQLRILPSAFDDLDRGRTFYAQHGEELGDYFLDSLFADIDSLAPGINWRLATQRRGKTDLRARILKHIVRRRELLEPEPGLFARRTELVV